VVFVCRCGGRFGVTVMRVVQRFGGVVLAVAIGFSLVGVAPAVGSDGGVAPYAALRWRNIGPFRGGRVLAVSGVVGDPRTFYFGSAGGGIWTTGDAGVTWHPLTDTVAGSGGPRIVSIGAISVAPSDPQTIYAGSGEADMRNDITHGDGM
jgi:hypothetical protein